jgi:hypothetical protein
MDTSIHAEYTYVCGIKSGLGSGNLPFCRISPSTTFKVAIEGFLSSEKKKITFKPCTNQSHSKKTNQSIERNVQAKPLTKLGPFYPPET